MKKKSLAATATPSKKPEALVPKNSLFDFILKGFNTTPSSSTKSKKPAPISATKASVLIKTTTNVPSPSPASVTSISDLKDFASSRLDSLKRQLDLSDAEILKDFEASRSRISKRYKMQTQACQQKVDEADKEHRRLAEIINENIQVMKTSYAEGIAKVEASANRVLQTSIPELAQSMEKTIEGLRNTYGIPLNSR